MSVRRLLHAETFLFAYRLFSKEFLLQFRNCFDIKRRFFFQWAKNRGITQFCRLVKPYAMGADGSDLSVQIHFSPKNSAFRKRNVIKRRKHGGNKRQVQSRFLQTHASADFCINVDLSEIEAQAFFQNRQQKVQAVDIKA